MNYAIDDPHRPAMTMLDAFCLAHGISTSALAYAADCSRQVAARLRYGESEMCIEMGKRIARGASRIVGRKVPVGELFDLDFDFPAT